jgi:nucleoside-diphosphate-sugar epimerase
LEKLATEELCKHYTKDFGIECRIGRFHNIYGPFGTWKGWFLTTAITCNMEGLLALY